MKQVALDQIKDKLPRYLRLAETEDIIITRRGVPVGILIGVADPEEVWEELLLNHPRIQARVARARRSLRAGHGVSLEELRAKLAAKPVARKRRAPITKAA